MKGAFLLVVLVHVTFISANQGGWSGWSEWSSWGKNLCSGNQRVKTRTCTNPMPSSGTEYCDGDSSKTEDGTVDGGLSEWTQWSSCEKPCGGSIVNRTRLCDNPPSSNGGRPCSGKTVETKMECVMPCPESKTDGNFSPWSDWTICPKTCTKSGGIPIKRYRQCNMPPPMFGGLDCVGSSMEETIGCFNVCPVDGGFSQWSAFTACSKTCGNGLKSRFRLCNAPEPRGDTARNCTGDFTEVKHCRFGTCEGAINGKWASWGRWSVCSEKTECFKGHRKRVRTCTNPAPSKGGDDCLGAGDETEVCPKTNCKDTRPTPPPTMPVQPGDYIHRECGATIKKIGSTVPAGVLNILSFQKSKFVAGYHATQTEEDGKIVKYCFEPWPPLTIKEAASKVPSYYRAKELPNFKRPSDDTIPIPGFSVRIFNDGSNKLKGWDFGVSEVYEYLPGNKVKLNDVMFTYFSEGSYWGFLAKGNFKLFNPYDFNSFVAYNKTQDLAYMHGKSPAIALRGFLNMLGIPEDIGGFGGAQIKALKSLGIWDYEFKPASIAYDFRHEFKAAFRLTATADIKGIPIHFEILYVHSGFDRKFAFGFQFDGESYGAMLEKMSNSGSVGKAVTGFLNKLGVQLEVGVAYCPSFFGEFAVYKLASFSKQPLKSVFKKKVTEGLTASAQLSIPKDCGDSSFCKILKFLVGPDAKFRMMGNIQSGYFKVSAGFYKIRLYKEYYLSKMELSLEVNKTKPERKMAFVVEMQIPVKGDIVVDGIPMESKLNLGGMISHVIGGTSVVGNLYMRGMWRKAFGLEWLAMGNINLGLTIDAAKPPYFVTGFQLGGQLEFGYDCLYEGDFENDGHCLRFQIYFAIGKPTYFYGKVSALTIGKIARMAGGKGGLPEPVARAGFPKGLFISFNGGKKDEDLRTFGGPIVKQGFRLKGILDLFGYQIKADIIFSKREIKLDVEIDPINLGGHVIMSRNATHKNVGPRLLFHYKSTVPGAKIKIPYFKMYFEGYVKILGIEIGAYLNVTTEALEIYIYGKVWDLLYCEVYVAAGYNYLTIMDSHFYIRVIIDLRGLTKAIEKARKAVDGAFKSAQATLRNAIEKVKKAKQDCKEKLKLDCSRCMSLKCKKAENDCKGFLNAAGKWIANTAKKAWNTVKSWFGRRRRRSLLDQRNKYFDTHVRRKRFISKLICEGVVGGGCKAVAHLCYGSCKVVDYIGQGLCNIVDIAVGALKLAEKACGWINAAIQFLLQMFLIHFVGFELGLGQKHNGFMVGAEIDMTLFGNRMYFGFQFDLKNPFRSITSAKDSSLNRYKQGVRQLRSGLTYNPYDRPNPFSDFDLAGTFSVEALQLGTESRVGGCISALTKGDNSPLKVLPCNEKDERQRWTYTVHGLLINLYSKKCMYFGNSAGSDLTQFDCEKGKKPRMEHECDVSTRTLKRRRKDLCVTISKMSNLGPGSIAQHSSMKCIHLNPANRLVLRTGCNRVDTEFKINEKGHLIFVSRKLCARAVGGNAVAGSKLELTHNMANCHQFEFTTLGSIRHVQSRLCVQTPNMEEKPNDYTELVLGSKCDYKQGMGGGGSTPDTELTFTFLPQENSVKMQYCGDFYDTKLEQRFAVMYEELNSVCTKYAENLAHSKVASQSSVLHNGFASRAVDGNFNFQWEKGSCTHTNEEQDPWWRVDLGKEYIITDVIIINRGEFGERLKNIQVHIGQHLDIKQNPVCHERVRSAKDGDAIRLTCDPPIPGQFVGVQMYGKGILTMCEVIVSSRLGGFGDWCRIENGGCEQICYNSKCGQKTTCGCLAGYQLAYDGRSCIDINECLSNNGGCRVDKQAHCVNYPGGYFCGCNKGYILKDNSLNECVDLNECGYGNGGCEQMCNNTLGGYLCTCRKGFERKADSQYGCQNINECLLGNGGCEHKCKDFEGGHYCSCRAGYRLREDGKACEELYCPVLEAPYHGLISPSTCSKKYENIKVGTNCNFQCSKGYELKSNVGAETLTCRIDGTWNHGTPNCHPVKCPILQRPANGGLVPARCHFDSRGFNEYGQRCVAYCKHGYRLRGAPTKYCQADKTWTNSSSTIECVKIVEPPYLNCPPDIQAVLPANANQMKLGSLYEPPQTNMDKSTMLAYPDNVGPDHMFKYGKTLVSHVAQDSTGQQLACSHFVDIRDDTPPTVTNCPSDITKTTSKPGEIITWTEPKFTDNVGIRHMMLPIRKSGELWTVGEQLNIMYMATDSAGNQKKCNFKVSVKSSICPEMVSDDQHMISVISPRFSYSVGCKDYGKALFGDIDVLGDFVQCQGGSYFIGGVDIGHTLPDCVPKTAVVNDECGEGYEKKSYSDIWTGGFAYFCAACPTGTFYYNATKSCLPCFSGEYQDEHGKLTCQLCPIGTSTASKGSKSKNDCIAKCKAGYSSPSGLDIEGQNCKLCPLGSYSYTNGTIECTVCPGQSTTDGEGSTDEFDCKEPTRITNILPSKQVTAVRNFEVHLECYFEAIPAPKASWTKDGGSLSSSAVVEDMYDFDMKFIGISLRFRSVSVADTGKYVCTINNSAGSDTETVELKVV